VIFSQSPNRENAWKFLEWFTSDEIQTDYGREIEAALGSISRYTPANTAAFHNFGLVKRKSAAARRACAGIFEH